MFGCHYLPKDGLLLIFFFVLSLSCWCLLLFNHTPCLIFSLLLFSVSLKFNLLFSDVMHITLIKVARFLHIFSRTVPRKRAALYHFWWASSSSMSHIHMKDILFCYFAHFHGWYTWESILSTLWIMLLKLGLFLWTLHVLFFNTFMHP